MKVLDGNESGLKLDSDIVEGLLRMFDEHNKLAKVFRTTRDHFV